MSIAQNYPTIAPSMSMDFAAVQALDPRITFARATTATYYGTRTAKAEENLLLYSQEFDNAYWTKVATTVTANSTTAPDGTTTADTVTYIASGTLSRTIQSATTAGVSGQTVTKSVYLKYNGQQFIQILFLLSGSQYANFDLVNGTVTQTSASCTASIVNVGSGWYRCIATATYTSSGTDNSYVWAIDSGTNIFAPNSTTGSSVYAWGYQLEQRSAVSAYTLTTTQSITNYIPVLETAASGVARFDHNPISGDSLGFLVEQQSTNLATYSSEFDNAAWNKVNATITANQIVAPDGTLSGELLTDNATNGGHNIQVPTTTTTVQSYTLSVYAKASSLSKIMLYGLNADGKGTGFDLSNGTTFTVTGITLSTSSSIVAVGNGWYRCSIVFTGAATTGNVGGIYTVSGTTFSYAGTGQSVFVWGAQLEALALPTTYIATVASQVTRAADAASMTGTNFSSWYSQGQGTLYVENLAQNAAAANNKNLRFSDGTTSNEIWLGSGSPGTSSRSQITLGGVNYFDSNISNQVTAGQFGKYALAFETNNTVLCSNGTLGTVDTAVAIASSINQFAIIPPSQRAGYYKKIAYYPVAVTSAQLQALTS